MFLLVFAAISSVAAIVSGVITWAVIREDRRRSAARVARLASAIDEQDLAPGTSYSAAGASGPVRTSHELFASSETAAKSSRVVATAVAGIFVVLAAGALLVVASSPRARIRAAASTQSSPAPLELVALQHEREATQLTIRGIVRNPSGGSPLDHLSAVVLLFDADGGFINSERTDVSGGELGPGGQATFAVTVPNADGVSRYRVSFRSADRVVPHVDRRT